MTMIHLMIPDTNKWNKKKRWLKLHVYESFIWHHICLNKNHQYYDIWHSELSLYVSKSILTRTIKASPFKDHSYKVHSFQIVFTSSLNLVIVNYSKMKVLIAIACMLLLCNAASAQTLCCGPYLDYQGFTDLYLGTVDLNLLPGTPPGAYLGLAR